MIIDYWCKWCGWKWQAQGIVHVRCIMCGMKLKEVCDELLPGEKE